jgi:hypothetical protein
MILEFSYVIVGGINLALEKSWKLVDLVIKKYPQATWRKVVNKKKGLGKYIVDIQ